MRAWRPAFKAGVMPAQQIAVARRSAECEIALRTAGVDAALRAPLQQGAAGELSSAIKQ